MYREDPFSHIYRGVLAPQLSDLVMAAVTAHRTPQMSLARKSNLTGYTSATGKTIFCGFNIAADRNQARACVNLDQFKA